MGEHVAVETVFVGADAPSLEEEIGNEMGKSKSEKNLE